MPAYGLIDRQAFGIQALLDPFPVPMGQAEEAEAAILHGTLGEELSIYLVDNPHYFDRENIYGYEDDAERFIFFCRSALELCRRLGWQPQVIHCNDWHTAIVPNWLHTIYAEDPFFAPTATVYTIHNLQYQGIFGWHALEIAGLDEYGLITHPEVAPSLNEVVDLMARGILFADVINTVSPTYARQILTPEYGEGLDPILRERRDRLYGILNGIDTELWNPATDEHIARNYDAETLDRRADNKLDLQAECQLPQDPHVPLIGMISRLVDQKGLDLLEDALEPILNLGVQFVLLGVGDQHYHEMLRRMAEQRPDQMAVSLTFNPPLAHKIYAGSDMFLMPSRFEPCGLGQMIAMRYGSVPVVRATGGLADTVHDFDPRSGQGNGFAFEAYDPWAFFAAVVRAIETYKHVDLWRQLQLRGMRADFSWDTSARQYVELYHQALEVHNEPLDAAHYGVARSRIRYRRREDQTKEPGS
jgi:starch synthase